MRRVWNITPKQSVERETSRRGERAVVEGCVALLDGGAGDAELLLALGGPHARLVLEGHEGGTSGYWPRVWAVRALLYAWHESARAPLIAATRDPHWRVREMSARVIARRRLGDAILDVAALQHDDVPRVRRTAERAVATLATHRA